MSMMETRVPRIVWYGTELADYLLAAGVPIELCDYDKRTGETVIVHRATELDVATLLSEFVPSPPPPSRDERIAAADTLSELKAALVHGMS